MGKTVEYADDEPAKMKKESKKNKNVTDDSLLSGDDNGHVETNGDCLKKKKKDKHVEKKRKSDTKEDGETNGDGLKKERKDKRKEKSESESKEADGSLKKEKKKDKRKEKKSDSESKEDETDGDSLKKKKKKRDKNKKSDTEARKNAETDGDGLKKRKDKRKEKKSKSESKDGDEDQHDEGSLGNDDSQNKKRKRTHSSEEARIEENELDPKPEKKKKKTKKIDGQNTEDKSLGKQKVKGGKAKSKEIESGENNAEKPKKKSKSKKVSFSGHVEIFPTSDTEPDEQTTKGDGLVRGKRFTPEEDEIVRQAVLDYVDEKGLGDEGLKMVLNCRSHKGMKKCWQEIGLCIPYRPYTAVYYRAHNLFERAETRSWTPEEIQLLKEYHKKYGNDWKKLAEELGKHRFHVKDTWRRIKFENLKSGRWTQEEYQNLYDLVNLDLQMKISGEEKKKSKHGMLRDNIPWTAISEKLTTRTDATCCEKWYNQLTSSLVVEKKWSDADDYRMIGALYELDAACIEDVEWDDVLEHRPGEICLQRWYQMVKYIGDYRSKSFAEQVDVLAQRYCPDLAETRETWDSKPVVD